MKYKFYRGAPPRRGAAAVGGWGGVVTRHGHPGHRKRREGGGCLVTIRLPIET